MAAALMARDLRPQAIICSTAVRTRKTLVPLLNLMKGTVSLTFSSELYSASAHDYMQMVAHHGKDLKPDDILMFIGHNFAIQDAALQMAVKSQTPAYQNLKEKFPSGAIAVLELANGFSSCGPNSAVLKDFLRPRDDL